MSCSITASIPDKNLRLNCPFHEDETPSLQVYYKSHTAYCFSSNCKTHGKSMDVIYFVMYMEGFDNLILTEAKHQALKKCKELIGSSSIRATPAEQLVRSAVLARMFIYFNPGGVSFS